MIAFIAAAALLTATASGSYFLLSRRSLVANVFGFGLALEVAGQVVLAAGNGLVALLESL